MCIHSFVHASIQWTSCVAVSWLNLAGDMVLRCVGSSLQETRIRKRGRYGSGERATLPRRLLSRRFVGAQQAKAKIANKVSIAFVS